MLGAEVWLYVAYFFLFVSLYFEVFMLVRFLEYLIERPDSKKATLPEIWPNVAIIVPCFNEERTVSATINSLLALEYPDNLLEIIVVDDGSSDRTWQVPPYFRAESAREIFDKENGGKHTAMNFALAHTTAAIIGCLDADSTVAPTP